ncbi:MAG: 23S rRNA (guanosine(2251)-2'-O)-methyltransferase RlmB [Nitrospira sp.]|nr:23S rRNA (guanosine(2251)-2'-O)-methyltransferase RlmB [Nitrospira sp.]
MKKEKDKMERIYGLNPVLEAIRAGRKIQNIFISSSRHNNVPEIKKEAEGRGIPVKILPPTFFDSTFQKGHQGVAAEVLPKTYINLDDLLRIPVIKNEIPLFIILDCIEDPRNFGAILRVADAAGVHGIVIQSHRSVMLGPEVSKASAGAVEYVPVSMVANVKHAIYEMKERGITVVGADAGADNVAWDIDLKVPLAIVIGSEGKGLRKTVKEHCDILVRIPMHGKINSLNVSVATGIVLFEILRQRMKNS